MQDRSLNMHINCEKDVIFISLCKANNDLISYDAFYVGVDNNINKEINRIKNASIYLKKNEIHVYTTGDTCQDLYEKICNCLNNSNLKIEYINLEEKKEKTKIKRKNNI